MTSLRDLTLKRKQRDEKKVDVKPRHRSVICAEDGSRTSGSVWADENNKTVWHQRFGSGGVGRAKCEAIVPELGLGVIVTPTDDKLGWEVVEDDPFLRLSATDNRNYQTIQPSDLQPGGRLMLWVDSRVVMPLAIYDTPGTLQINVISGWYAYNGVRVFFPGQINYDLTSSVPGGGLTRYVGLYLDSANTLQRIDGATIAIGSTPAEPAWPAGAFQLCVVQLDNGQTSISFADDILDRRMAWSDLDSFRNWPFDHILTVSSTNLSANYATIALAIAAAATGDTIQPDSETHVISGTLTSGVNLAGLDRDNTILENTTSTTALTTIDSLIENLTLRIERSVAGAGIIAIANGSGRFNNCVIEANNTHATGNARALWQGGVGSISGFGVKFIATAVGGTATALDIDAGTCTLIGGELEGDVALDIAAGATVLLLGTWVKGSITNAGTLNGYYYDNTGGLVILAMQSMPSGVWLIDESATTRLKEADIPTAITAAAASGDLIEVEANTYTAPNVAGGITVDESLSIVGKSPQETIITRADDSSVVMTVSDTPVTLRNLTIQHTGGTGAGGCTNLATDQAGLVLDNVYIIHTVGTDGNHVGLLQTAGDSLLKHCKINVSGGTLLNYSVYLGTAGSTCVIEGGEVLAGTIATAHASAIIELRGVKLASGVQFDVSGGGVIRGWYINSAGQAIIRGTSFSAYNTATQSINANTWTKVVFDTEESDTNGDFDLANDKFLPTIPGEFILSAQVELASFTAAGRYIILAIYKNGGSARESYIYSPVTSSGSVQLTSKFSANGTTDYFEVYVNHNNDAATNLTGTTNGIRNAFAGALVEKTWTP